MAKLVVLWPAEASVRIGQAEAAELGKLGVASVALLRDDTSIGVVLDGWAFDAERSGERAEAVLADEPPLARLRPVAEIGVMNAVTEAGRLPTVSPGTEDTRKER